MDGRVVRARVKRGGRLRTGAAVASVLLLGSLAGLTGCGTTGPSDADRASWQSWAAAIVDSDPDATVSGGFDANADPASATVDFNTPTAFQALELRCIGTDRAEFSLAFVAEDATFDSRQDIVCQGGATRTAIAVPIAVRDLVSLTVTATSADGEGVWTAQLQR